MATSFPTALDNFTNPTSANLLSNSTPKHSLQHSNLNDAVAALEAKVGIDSSANIASLDYLLKSLASVDPGHKHTSAAITDFNEAAQDATGAMVNSTLFYNDLVPSLGINLSNPNTWLADQTMDTNIALLLGATGKLYSDGTYTIINPLSGQVCVGVPSTTTNSAGASQTGGSKHLLVDQMGLGGSVISTFFWINFQRTTTAGRGALNFEYVYTGAGPTLNILSILRYRGTATNITALSQWNQAYLGADTTGSGTLVGYRTAVGFDGTTAITAGGTKRLHGITAEWSGDGGTHTNGNILWYGVRVPTKPNLTLSGATYTGWAGNFGFDVQLYDEMKLILGGSDSVKGDSYFIYNAASTDIDLYVNATQVINFDNDLVDCKLPFQIDGSSGNTLQFINPAGSPPPLAGAAPTAADYWGLSNSGKQLLADPDIWITVNVGGTDYLIPGYTP